MKKTPFALLCVSAALLLGACTVSGGRSDSSAASDSGSLGGSQSSGEASGSSTGTSSTEESIPDVGEGGTSVTYQAFYEVLMEVADKVTASNASRLDMNLKGSGAYEVAAGDAASVVNSYMSEGAELASIKIHSADIEASYGMSGYTNTSFSDPSELGYDTRLEGDLDLTLEGIEGLDGRHDWTLSDIQFFHEGDQYVDISGTSEELLKLYADSMNIPESELGNKKYVVEDMLTVDNMSYSAYSMQNNVASGYQLAALEYQYPGASAMLGIEYYTFADGSCALKASPTKTQVLTLAAYSLVVVDSSMTSEDVQQMIDATVKELDKMVDFDHLDLAAVYHADGGYDVYIDADLTYTTTTDKTSEQYMMADADIRLEASLEILDEYDFVVPDLSDYQVMGGSAAA